ncbi:hypothetical protein D3C81_2060840 [compost metagenome]
MPQHQNQRCAEHGDCIFKAGQAFVGDKIAGHTDGEKIAACSVEGVLRGDP